MVCLRPSQGAGLFKKEVMVLLSRTISFERKLLKRGSLESVRAKDGSGRLHSQVERDKEEQKVLWEFKVFTPSSLPTLTEDFASSMAKTGEMRVLDALRAPFE